MSEISATPTRLVIHRKVIRDGQTGDESLMYEGEVPVEDQVNLKGLIGDGLSKVTASREVSEKDYGKGGSVHISVTLTCDQSLPIIDSAAAWAKSLASKYANENWYDLRAQLVSLGLLQ